MSVIDKFLAKFYTKKIGEDNFGNTYHISLFKNYLGKNKRIVIYNSLDLHSKVPPMWHGWLHYMIDDIPRNPKKIEWKKNYQPWLTRTKYKCTPPKLTNNKEPNYKRWKPEE